MEPTSHDRHERAARNQSLFREVNERIEEMARGVDGPTFTAFACECADPECLDSILMTLEEYELVRRRPTWFPVKPGHVFPDVERVLPAEGDGIRYTVVEKMGEAGRLAVALDPRSGTGEPA